MNEPLNPGDRVEVIAPVAMKGKQGTVREVYRGWCEIEIDGMPRAGYLAGYPFTNEQLTKLENK